MTGRRYGPKSLLAAILAPYFPCVASLINSASALRSASDAVSATVVMRASTWPQPFDADDPLARAPDAAVAPRFGSRFRFGVPTWPDLEFFGDEAAVALFGAAIGMLEMAGGTRIEVSCAPFRDAGRLLYEGPWVAERLHATQALLIENPDAVFPVTREILEGARDFSALDAYRAQYELAALRRAAADVFAGIDVLLLPTAGTIYETAAVTAEPKQLNANLGLYTNFVNLLDLAAIALPAGFGESGLPFGISLIAQAYRDFALLDLGARFQDIAGLPLGASRAQTLPIFCALHYECS